MSKPYVLMTPPERLQTRRGQYEAEQARLGWPDRAAERERQILDDEQKEDFAPEPRFVRYLDLSGCCEAREVEGQ